MKVFLSWSKPLSHAVAKEFAKWLPTVIQACRDPYVSSETAKGEAWFQAITTNLVEAGAGVAFITQANEHEQWVNFEAGAMYAQFGKKLYPVLIDIEKTDYDGPLKNLQVTEITDKADMLLLIRSINSQVANPVADATLEHAFNGFWPEFEAEILKAVGEQPETKPAETRTLDDKVDEILLTIRDLSARPIQSVSASIEERAKKIFTLGSTERITDLFKLGLGDYFKEYPKNRYVIQDGTVVGEVVGAVPLNGEWFLSVEPLFKESGIRPYQQIASRMQFSDAPF